jgi:FixJ family two-component response regulator
MTGAELAAKMLELNPQVRILVASGYSVDISRFPPAHRAQIGFLKKPFTPEMLATSVKETFGE